MRFCKFPKGLYAVRSAAVGFLAAVVGFCSLSVDAVTMRDAKGQQSALEVWEQDAQETADVLAQDAADKLSYANRLEEEAAAVEKDIDAVNRKVVLMDRGIAKAAGNETADTALMQKARENLLAEKSGLDGRLENLRALQERIIALAEDDETARLAAEKEAELLTAERAKTDAAIDDWYARYQAAQAEAGISTDNLGGDVLQGAGAFQWPMPGYTEMTQYFGDGGHRGIDIAGGGIYGKSIVAAADGTVAYAGWMGSYGYVVFIDHGNGYQTRYAHMSALGCQVGDQITGGGIIGYVGSTGNSTGPHLHFEILYGENIQDPLLYF